MITYQIVVSINGSLTSLTTTDLVGFCAANDIAVTGTNHNPHQRTELQGQPRLRGFCGPMYGGPGLIRYECPQSYADLSI